MADTLERNNIGRIVNFLLHTDRLRANEYDLAKISMLVRHIGSTKEFLDALVYVLHSAREVIKLEEWDAAYSATERALAPKQPQEKFGKSLKDNNALPVKRARKHGRGGGQRDLFGGKA
jgi:hypothetical protein